MEKWNLYGTAGGVNTETSVWVHNAKILYEYLEEHQEEFHCKDFAIDRIKSPNINSLKKILPDILHKDKIGTNDITLIRIYVEFYLKEITKDVKDKLTNTDYLNSPYEFHNEWGFLAHFLIFNNGEKFLEEAVNFGEDLRGEKSEESFVQGCRQGHFKSKDDVIQDIAIEKLEGLQYKIVLKYIRRFLDNKNSDMFSLERLNEYFESYRGEIMEIIGEYKLNWEFYYNSVIFSILISYFKLEEEDESENYFDIYNISLSRQKLKNAFVLSETYDLEMGCLYLILVNESRNYFFTFDLLKRFNNSSNIVNKDQIKDRLRILNDLELISYKTGQYPYNRGRSQYYGYSIYINNIDLVKEDIDEIKSRKGEARKGYVYIIKSGEYYKIGKTIDLKNRLKSLRTGIATEIEVVENVYCGENYSKVENMAHKRFEYCNVEREWFQFKNDDLKDAVNFIKKYEKKV